MNIVWKGNQYTNSSSREGYVPIVIVNHISSGTMSSMDSWFTSSGNEVSSAHFGVSKDGRIHQYVDIRRMAWANGVKSEQARQSKTPVVREMKVNPNLYSISIEHEGTDGKLTEAQYKASLWLHFFIRDEILRIWKKDIPLTPFNVIGHFQIDPIRKASCPGKYFPWERLYDDLKKSPVALSPETAKHIIENYLQPNYMKLHEKLVEGKLKDMTIGIQKEVREKRDKFGAMADELRKSAGLI